MNKHLLKDYSRPKKTVQRRSTFWEEGGLLGFGRQTEALLKLIPAFPGEA